MNFTLKDLRLNELDTVKKRKLITIYFGSSGVVEDDDLVSTVVQKKLQTYFNSKGYHIDIPSDFYMEILDDYISITGTYGNNAEGDFTVMAELFTGKIFDHHVGK